MNMGATKTRLVAMTKEIRLKWGRTQDSWRDAKSGEFEQKYMTELAVCVDRTATVIEQLDKLVTKIRSDCE